MSGARDAVADELAIRDLVNRHADATSRLDAAGVAENFTEDAEWLATQIGAGGRGRDDLRALFAKLLQGWNVLIQGLLSGHVRLDPAEPDRATGRWYIYEFGQRADGSNFLSSGVYHDEYVREGEAWRFARRRYDSMYSRRGDAVTTSPFPADAPEIR